MMINYKKRDFYTRINNNAFGECAVKVSGYWFYQTDVKVDDIRWLIPLYTYKHGSVWDVVEGTTGLSVGPTFTTRKAAVEYVMRDEILDKLRNAVRDCVNNCAFTMLDEFPEEKTFDSFDSMKRAEEDIQRQCREEAEEAENKREEETMKQEPKKDYTRFFAGCETLEEANEIAERCEALDSSEESVLEALIDDGCDIDQALDIVESGDYVLYPDCGTMADVAEEYVEASGALSGVPDWIARYIDYDALGRDLEIEGTFLECGEGIVEIIR